MGPGTRNSPNRGLRVVVTRAASQAGPLVARLEALGYDVVACPLIEVVPLDGGPVDPAPYDWVVVTSPNGAAALATRLTAPPRRLAAIGPGTAAELRAHGLEPDLVPRESTQEGLLAELPCPPGRVLLAAAEGARRLLVDEVGADFLPLYRTVALAPAEPPAATSFCSRRRRRSRAFAATGARIPAIAIGPQTAAAVRDAGLELAAEAETHDEDGLVAALGRLG